MEQDTIKLILEGIQQLETGVGISFWKKPEFWISIAIGILSVVYSFIAYREAKSAKEAAYEAGKTVKIQTITIELTELVQKLDTLDMDIKYSTARDLFNEINRRVKRITAPFKDEKNYQETIEKINEVLLNTKGSLNEVRPIDDSEDNDLGFSVYNASESHFSDLSGLLAELMGLFEKRTIENS